MRAVLPVLLLTACGRPGFEAVDHTQFFGVWTTREPVEAPEGVRTSALRVTGNWPDGRDATFIRRDRTEHNDNSLTPGCVGDLWLRGWLVATETEARGPDPSDERFPNGRTAVLGALHIVVDDALVERAGCTNTADDLALDPSPGVITPADVDPEPVTYSRPTEETWWLDGARPVLFQAREGGDRPDLTWPE